MKGPRFLLPLSLLILLTPEIPRSAAASICEIEPKPAATLLLPYFEVDTVNLDGIDTLMTIHNASNRRDAVAKVELWSEFGVAVGGFNVYLPANGAQLLDLRKILDCKLPTAGPPASSPYRTSCASAFPPKPANCTVFQWKKSLTGQPSSYLGGQCAGTDRGDGIARGYVTVDMMNLCTTQYQGSLGYFAAGGNGAASNLNQLWGEYSMVDARRNEAFGDALVHIEASVTDPHTSVAGVYTFYGKFVGWAGADNREPLSSTQRARFVESALFDDGTDLLVWRDSKSLTSSVVCGGNPAWYPLGQSSLLFFGMSGGLSANLSASTALGRVAQRVHVGGSALPVPSKEGWMNVTFNTTVTGATTVPPANPNLDQGWVTAVAGRKNLFQAGASGLQVTSACTP